jgi:hypothetical protein
MPIIDSYFTTFVTFLLVVDQTGIGRRKTRHNLPRRSGLATGTGVDLVVGHGISHSEHSARLVLRAAARCGTKAGTVAATRNNA